ncbi:DUF4145 domain-containing protein [Bradyrhizobium barranii]|uniref:DUF4145 domain-containing protein n=1 Tax=Bradyrhizobium TaxID=374 RepID=UPI003390CEB4
MAIYEYAVQCRACAKASIWEVGQRANQHDPSQQWAADYSIDDAVTVRHVVRPKPNAASAPEHTPPELKLIFDEGAECISIGAWNAASAMFRKILDQISKDKMHSAPGGPPADNRTRFNLKPRLAWLFANNLLPANLEALADCIREDANDAVHNAPLGEDDALDIQDFTVELLEALFTLPGRLTEAEARRAARRGGQQ